MTSDFPRRIYDEVKDLFPKGAVETFVCRGIPAGGEVAPSDRAARLVHTPTGIEVTCADFPSQTENYIAAAVRLRIAWDKRG